MSISLQTFMPSVVTPNTQILVTDIDGDGNNEVIMLDSELKQLSICHQFSWGDLSLSSISSKWSSSTQHLWPGNTSLNWMTTWAVPVGGIPPAQETTFGAWQVGYGDVIMAADLDGDGIDELFIYNLTSLTWGVLKWQSNQLQIIAKLSVASASGSSPVTWQGSTADQFIVVPNLSSIMTSVTQHAAGILVYNSQTYALAMIAYASNSFSEPWNTTQTTLPGGWKLNGNSPQPTINEFMPGYFATAGVTSIAVFSPSTAYMALLQWDPQQKQFVSSSPGQGHQAGNWSYGSEDKHHIADLDGDGLSEMFIYAPNDGYIGVLKWVNGSFQSTAITRSQIGSGQNQWTPGKENGTGKSKQEDHYFCLNGSQNKSGPIYAFSPNGGPSNSPKVALLYYSNQSFNCAWAGSSLSPNNGWPVTAADTFYAGPSWDAATPQWITLSNQGPASTPVLTLGGAGCNGPTVSSGSQIQFVSSETVPIQSWSPAGLASNTPHTAFLEQWPNLAQQQIYAYISQLFPIPETKAPGTSDVRSLYSNPGDEGKWEGYAGDLAKVDQPSQIPSTWLAPPANNWSNTDWQAVQGTIVKECNQVDTAYHVYDYLGRLMQDFPIFQQQDLGTVKLNIKQASAANPVSELDYWLGQIFIDFLWALAAATAFITAPVGLGAALGTALSTVAAVAGSVVGYNPKQLKSYAEAEVEQEILNTTSNAIVSDSLDLTDILSDPVKLMILDGLHDNEWKMHTSLPSKIKQPFQLVDRLWMYQQLLPFYFNIGVYEPGANLPHTPTFPLSPSPNGVSYLLNDQNGYISASQFSGTTLYTDLFTNLGVTEEEFFAGKAGWSSIPRQKITSQQQNNSLGATGD